MEEVKLHFSKQTGKICPLHAVNNGPVYKFTEDQRITNIDAFREAAIPYARTHDASFCADYGGEHAVDVHAVFPDFSKDVNDPAAYDFTMTDEYMKVMLFAGVEPFYRLGSKIEHWPKKYGTLPPADFQKWAEICEHIMAHYLEGWADGFEYPITYWEIWNEPDGAVDDADYVDKKTWGGTRLQFCELFEITAKHLKKRFPGCKIGGPAVCYPITEWTEYFLGYCRDHAVPMDFFSWHNYHYRPQCIAETERKARALLNSYGYEQTESILNEWNYVNGWMGDEWLYSLRTEKNLKGAAFIAGTIELSVYEPVDMLMYYDARPCGMNGMFNTDFVCDRLKGYYPFYMFRRIFDLQNAAAVENNPEETGLMCCAAADGNDAAFMLTYYEDVDKAEDKQVKVSYDGLAQGTYEVTYSLLDADHDAEPVRTEIFCGNGGSAYLTLPLFGTYLVTFRKKDLY